jgi:ectoine hydroxylase-related dioxygenase (phytanoyl-CoA dioxygenase family)
MCIIVIFIIILLFIYISLVIKYIYSKTIKIKNYDLNKDGVVVISNFLNNDEIIMINNMIENDNQLEIKKYIHNQKKNILNLVGLDYEFQDYIFILKKSQFNACHRDYNGKSFNKNQKHPSYTLLIYLHQMKKCLDIIPKSHKNNKVFDISITDITESIKCNIGDAILFNSDLIHSGSINKNQNNPRIQMKITHKDDRNTLYFYENYNKQLNNPSKYNNKIQKLQKHISCIFPIISKYTEKHDKNKNNNNDDNLIYKLFFAKLDNI